jgi:hypothetical protein
MGNRFNLLVRVSDYQLSIIIVFEIISDLFFNLILVGIDILLLEFGNTMSLEYLNVRVLIKFHYHPPDGSSGSFYS